MQWEYKRVLLERWGGGEQKDDLNEQGEDGWELAIVYHMSDDRTPIGIFKRPVKDKKEVGAKLIPTEKGFEIQWPIKD